jgi:tetrahydromethanopterin S-methyltransferase subunit E
MENAMNAVIANVMVGNLGPTVGRIAARGRRPYPAAWKAALAVAAPLIGLVFVVAFPLVGLAILAWIGARALAKRAKPLARFAKNVALFVAAPFVGLAYAVAFPFVGMGFLVWRGTRAIVKRRETL